MPTITSLATGNWSDTSKWDLTRKPQSGDDVVIAAGHNITVNEVGYLQSLNIAGTITHSKNLIFDDSANALITITATGNWVSGGNSTTAVKIAMATSTPTYRVCWYIYDIVGADTRTLTFDYLYTENVAFFLGDDTNYVWMNYISTTKTDIAATVATPLDRNPSTIEHSILGRNRGRVYQGSNGAGTVTVSGSCHQDSFMWQVVGDIVSAKKHVALMTDRHFIPIGYIDRVSFRPRGGNYYDFSITVKEA